jgi:hypothetical protein
MEQIPQWVGAILPLLSEIYYDENDADADGVLLGAQKPGARPLLVISD